MELQLLDQQPNRVELMPLTLVRSDETLSTAFGPWKDVHDFTQLLVQMAIFSVTGTTPFLTMWLEGSLDDYWSGGPDPSLWRAVSVPFDKKIFQDGIDTVVLGEPTFTSNLRNFLNSANSVRRVNMLYRKLPFQYVRTRFWLNGTFGATEGFLMRVIALGK